MMQKLVLALLCALVAASVVESSYSSLNIEMKAMRADLNAPYIHEIERFASLRRLNDVDFFCAGYMISGTMLAARAHCILILNPDQNHGSKFISNQEKMYINIGEDVFRYKILIAHYSRHYQLDTVRSPADFAIMELDINPRNPLELDCIETYRGTIPTQATLRMLVMTYDRSIKAFHVQPTNLEKCNTGLTIPQSHALKNQMCVSLPIKYYWKIVGPDRSAGSRGSSGTTVIEKFASGSPLLYDGELAGLVSDYHILDGQYLYIHCTESAEFADIVKANGRVDVLVGWSTFFTASTEAED